MFGLESVEAFKPWPIIFICQTVQLNWLKVFSRRFLSEGILKQAALMLVNLHAFT
jgi:hypothetical protein